MSEEAQEVVVTNTGQPVIVEIQPAETYEQAEEAVVLGPTNQTVTLIMGDEDE